LKARQFLGSAGPPISAL